MEYRAVGNRCAVDLSALRLQIRDEVAMQILVRKGFKAVEVDIVRLARECVGHSVYCRGAAIEEAPRVVDCSSLVKWVYGRRGIWLPRRSIQQREQGMVVPADQIRGGDVLFVSGHIDYFDVDPTNGVGHVGIATDDETVIHAANKTSGVIESPLVHFTNIGSFRGVRRYIPRNRKILTIESPSSRVVEIADDFRWIILQSLQTHCS